MPQRLRDVPAGVRLTRVACYIPGDVKLPQVYRFKLSDREFAAAWLREYYRRPGLRIVRIVAGPLVFAVGTAMVGSTETFTHYMAIVAMAFGVWLAVKPLLMTWAVTSRRRRANRADVELEVRFDAKGMRVNDGARAQDLPWARLRAAGLREHYVWIELATGARATIPRRAIDDVDALRDLLASRIEWKA